MEEGNMVEQGSHSELIKWRGAEARLDGAQCAGELTGISSCGWCPPLDWRNGPFIRRPAIRVDKLTLSELSQRPEEAPLRVMVVFLTVPNEAANRLTAAVSAAGRLFRNHSAR